MGLGIAFRISEIVRRLLHVRRVDEGAFHFLGSRLTRLFLVR